LLIQRFFDDPESFSLNQRGHLMQRILCFCSALITIVLLHWCTSNVWAQQNKHSAGPIHKPAGSKGPLGIPRFWSHPHVKSHSHAANQASNLFTSAAGNKYSRQAKSQRGDRITSFFSGKGTKTAQNQVKSHGHIQKPTSPALTGMPPQNSSVALPKKSGKGLFHLPNVLKSSNAGRYSNSSSSGQSSKIRKGPFHWPSFGKSKNAVGPSS
jgi:hypothetical protein